MAAPTPVQETNAIEACRCRHRGDYGWRTLAQKLTKILRVPSMTHEAARKKTKKTLGDHCEGQEDLGDHNDRSEGQGDLGDLGEDQEDLGEDHGEDQEDLEDLGDHGEDQEDLGESQEDLNMSDLGEPCETSETM